MLNTNILVECLLALLRVRELPGSIHGPEIGFFHSSMKMKAIWTVSLISVWNPPGLSPVKCKHFFPDRDKLQGLTEFVLEGNFIMGTRDLLRSAGSRSLRPSRVGQVGISRCTYLAALPWGGLCAEFSVLYVDILTVYFPGTLI
jgi:hypothetical protein